MQKEDRFLKDHHVRRCPFFCPKSSEDQKKGHYVPRLLNALKLSKIFRGRMIWDVFTVHIMPKRRTFGHFLASSEDKFFWSKRRTCPPKGRRMVYTLDLSKHKHTVLDIIGSSAIKHRK